VNGISHTESSRGRAVALALLLTLAAMLVASANASAELSRPYERGFAFGTEAPDKPVQAIALDSDENVYVADQETHSLKKFDSEGNPAPFSASASYIDGNELTGTPAGVFPFGSQEGRAAIAIDKSPGPTHGYIYFAALGQFVAVFDSTGIYKGDLTGAAGVPCGVAVHPVSGEVYLSGFYLQRVVRLTPTDGIPANYTLNGTLLDNGLGCQVAVDSTGAVYLDHFQFGGGLMKFDASQFNSPTPVGTEIDPTGAAGIAIGPNDDLYLDRGDRIEQRSSANVPIGAPFGSGDLGKPDWPISFGVAVGATGDVYATTPYGQVSVFGPGPAINLPKLTTGAASAVVQNSATISGSVDPDGAGNVTGCVFKYGTSTRYESGTLPCDPAASGGSPFTTPTAVAADLSGLTSGPTYHYRLFSTNANGTQAGLDRTFATPEAVLDLTTGSVTAVAKDRATLHGTFTGAGQDVDYYFEYGTTSAYGQTEPVPPGADAGNATGPQVFAPVEIDGLLGDTTYHYRVVASNVYGKSFGADQTFTTANPVTNLTADAPTNVTNVSADLNGSFDADSYDTHYYFEYGQSASYGQTVPVPPGLDAGTGSGRVQVASVPIAGLQQGALYHFRIVATNATGITKSADRVFRTASAPSINSFSTDNVTVTGADLRADISPNQTETKYRFEYGTTSDYGASVPIPDGTLPGDLNQHSVSYRIENLIPGVTYHFRIVASNKYGTTASGDQPFGFYPSPCPNAQIRQETNANNLPDCRGYEIASAEDAGGVTIFPSSGPSTGYATNPSRLAYVGSFGVIPGAGDPPNSMGDLYVATRSPSGWSSKYMGLGADQTLETGGTPEFSAGNLLLQSPDWNQWGVQASPTMDRIVNYDMFTSGSNAPYVWDASTNDLVARWPTNLASIEGGEEFIGKTRASADLSHFVFSSNVVFAPGGQATPPEGFGPNPNSNSGAGAAPASIYDNDTLTGAISHVSVRADGSSFLGDPVAVSDDGSHILMSEGHYDKECSVGTEGCTADSTAFYLRVGGSVTYDIADGQKVEYLGTTANGRIIYFNSVEQLTSDDHDTSVDLFMWNEANPTSLTRISKGDTGNAGDTDTCSVAWATKCGTTAISFRSYSHLHGGTGGNRTSDRFIASGSGDIYFQSPEQLDGAKGEPDQVNLYLYRAGEVRYVTTMSDTKLCTIEQGSPRCSDGSIARMQVTADGRFAAFITASRVTSYDNAGKGEMYTYEPATERLVCASCKLDGSPPKYDVYGSQNGLFLANDGRAFFSTNDGIVYQDTNELIDVYEYVNGRPQLISSGIGPGPVGFAGFTGLMSNPGLLGVSANGVDVFFATFDRYVTQDRNGQQLKIYDARVNGGFPAEALAPGCAAADECHGPSSSPPPPMVDGAGAKVGKSGNLAKKRQQKKAKQKKAKQRKKKQQQKAQRAKQKQKSKSKGANKTKRSSSHG
jgi:hypothetical protein